MPLRPEEADDGALPPRDPCSERAREGFPRSARLLRRRDYERVFDGAVRSRDAGFTVLAVASCREHARLGLAVSKRQVRSAVERNRLKRRIRESFRRERALLAGLDLVVMAKREAGSWSGEAVFASLARHWDSVRRRWAG